MIKNLKISLFAIFVLSVLCFIGGIGFSKLEKADQGVHLQTGYMENGKLVITNNDAGVLGSNKKGQETAQAMSAVCYSLSGIFFILGFGLAIAAICKNNTTKIL